MHSLSSPGPPLAEGAVDTHMLRPASHGALRALLLLQMLCASGQGNQGAGKGAAAPIDAGVPTPHQTGVTAIGGTPMQTADVRRNQPDLLHRETDSAPAKSRSLLMSLSLLRVGS